MFVQNNVTGLTVIWQGNASSNDQAFPSRLPLEMGLVQLALGGRARIFVTGPAVAHLRRASKPRDELIPKMLGLPQLHAMLDEFLAAGGRVVVCQTAAASHKMAMDTLDPRIEAGGLVSLMQGLGDDRLVVI